LVTPYICLKYRSIECEKIILQLATLWLLRLKAKAVCIILLLVLSESKSDLITTGSTFLGTGYNIVDGNPEGSSIRNGGLDPGLRSSDQILKATISSSDVCPQEASRVR